MIINEMPGGAPLGPTTANAATIFNGKTAYDSNGNLITGTAMATASNLADSFMLQGAAGYTNDGIYVSGSIPNKGTITTTTSYGGSYTIPYGLHSGSGKVTGGTFSFSGNAGTGDVASGKTFYSNSGTKQTGTLQPGVAPNGSTASLIATTNLSAGTWAGLTTSDSYFLKTTMPGNVAALTRLSDTTFLAIGGGYAIAYRLGSHSITEIGRAAISITPIILANLNGSKVICLGSTSGCSITIGSSSVTVGAVSSYMSGTYGAGAGLDSYIPINDSSAYVIYGQGYSSGCNYYGAPTQYRTVTINSNNSLSFGSPITFANNPFSYSMFQTNGYKLQNGNYLFWAGQKAGAYYTYVVNTNCSILASESTTRCAPLYWDSYRNGYVSYTDQGYLVLCTLNGNTWTKSSTIVGIGQYVSASFDYQVAYDNPRIFIRNQNNTIYGSFYKNGVFAPGLNGTEGAIKSGGGVTRKISSNAMAFYQGAVIYVMTTEDSWCVTSPTDTKNNILIKDNVTTGNRVTCYFY